MSVTPPSKAKALRGSDFVRPYGSGEYFKADEGQVTKANFATVIGTIVPAEVELQEYLR